MTIRDGPLEKQVLLGGDPRRNFYSDNRAEKGLHILGKKQKLLFQIRHHICKLDEEGGRRTRLSPAADAIISRCGFLPPKHTDSANLGAESRLTAAQKQSGWPWLSSSCAGAKQKPLVSE